MPPNKRMQKKALKLECEWGSCQESFNRMENFCKHVEGHLSALEEEEEEEEETEGEVKRSFVYVWHLHSWGVCFGDVAWGAGQERVLMIWFNRP